MPDEPTSRAAEPLRAHALGPVRFALLAIALGVVAGLGAYGFRLLISLFHNLLLRGELSVTYDANVHTPIGPLGIATALAPVVGAVVVVFLVKNFAPEAKGHGVPEVMDAIYYKKGVIRPRVAAIKSFASAISIGSGGSVGREGPIIQIGAAFASWLGHRTKVSRWQLVTLVSAGGGAGIAATFNTPIGGVLFAVEVLMSEISVRTLIPVALATATATFVGQFLFGDTPAFPVPVLHTPFAAHAALLPAYMALGVVMALVAVVFIKSLYAAEDRFERTIRNDYLRHAIGMLAVGAIGMALMKTVGHYYVLGVGYATVLDVLDGTLTGIALLLLLFVLKLVVTSLTLGSGASGGVFSPSLFMGATIGGAFGLALHALIPGLEFDPATFALAGMAGMVAATTGATLTAIVMIFEMTLDYSVVLPMTLTAAVAHGVRKLLLADSIYTMKLTRRGHVMPGALQANAHLVHHVGEIALGRFRAIASSAAPAELGLDDSADAPPHVVVVDGARVVGVIEREWLASHRARVDAANHIGELVRDDSVTVASSATLIEVLADMHASRVTAAVVVGPADAAGHTIRGVLTKALLAEVIAQGMELFGD